MLIVSLRRRGRFLDPSKGRFYGQPNERSVGNQSHTSQQYIRFSDGSSSSHMDLFRVHVPTSPALVPSNYVVALLQSGQLELAKHMRWMMQKDTLGQDMFLIGAPGPLRRRLAMSFCELSGREMELLTLSQDTTEADLRQRREIVDSTAVYIDQAPLRAALEGRILILDGMEKAERNVLPTLNNLLENREMSLSDGRFLISAARYDSLLKSGESVESLNASGLLRVSEQFRVIALGLPVPEFAGYPIDPPLRSRFQGRYVRLRTSQEQVIDNCLNNKSVADTCTQENLSQVASFFHSISQIKSKYHGSDSLNSPKLLPIPETALRDAFIYLNAHPKAQAIEVIRSIYPYHLFGLDVTQMAVLNDLTKSFDVAAVAQSITDYHSKAVHSSALVGHQKLTLENILRIHELGQDICLMGDKGEGLYLEKCLTSPLFKWNAFNSFIYD